MKSQFKLILSILLLLTLSSTIAFSQFIINGSVIDNNKNIAIQNATIQVKNSSIRTITDDNGKFILNFKNSGNLILNISKNGYENYVHEVKVDNSSLDIVIKLSEKSYNLNDIVVFGASKRLEKITESPAAITILHPDDIQMASRSNQIGNALSGTPGVDVLLNGSSDFIVNSRGFNNGLNRRLLVLQDGRDLAMPLLGAQEWNSSSLPLDEFAKIEFIKGPASALYGANCFNGVMALTSYAPKEVIGTKLSLTLGDYETFRGDIRHAGYITNDLTYKVTLGRSGSLNLSRSRTDSSQLEYIGAKLERRPIYEDERNTFSKYGTLRFDYELSTDKNIVLEGGYSDSGNEVFVQPLGRVLVTNTQKPYLRLAYNSENINFQGSYSRRDVQDSMWLLFAFRGPTFPLGSPILTDDGDLMLDLQYNTSLDNEDKYHIILGVSQQYQNVNTHATTLKDAIDADFTGIYGQIDMDLTKYLKIVASGRYDRTNIHEAQFSPRLAIVLSASENHKFRLSGSSSFQRPNYSELYRYTPDRSFNGNTLANLKNIDIVVSDSLRKWTGNSNLSNINLGLNTVRGYAVGNETLKVEKNLGLEFGYQGIFGNDIFITADIYYNKINDFITNFGPGYNPKIQKWSAILNSDLAQYTNAVNNLVYNKLVGDDKTRLANYNGQTALIQSVGNFGEVNQYGIDLSLNWYLINELILGANYSYYSFSMTLNPGDPVISSNTSPNKANISLQYIEKKHFDIKATLQYMDTYLWIAGASIGQVPSYAIVNINAGYHINNNVEIGVNIFNLFNSNILQIFGGTYLPRYATAKINVEL